MKRIPIQKNTEGWDKHKKILVILAHPDDPEFFLGATICRWTRMGHEVNYLLLTKGDKGGGKDMIPEKLIPVREKEQKAAALSLGVKQVHFFDYPDGYLVPSLDLRRAIVRWIRKIHPDIVVSCDPGNLFPRPGLINHPDHRAAGQAVIDSVFPAAGNYHYFPELLCEGLEPVKLEELWLSSAHEPNLILDVTDTWKDKIRALHEHKSQIGDIELFDRKMWARHTPGSTPDKPCFEEKFYRIIFS